MRLTQDEATVDAVAELLDPRGASSSSGSSTTPRSRRSTTSWRRTARRTRSGATTSRGFATKRIYALFAKIRGFDELATDPLLLGVLDRVLVHYQLSGPVGIDIGPGETPQGLHRDDVVYPIPWPHQQVVLNTMWALDDFTEDNGATADRARQPSHVTGGHARRTRTRSSRRCRPARVMFYVGTVWHGGGANRTDERRLGVILEYARRGCAPRRTTSPPSARTSSAPSTRGSRSCSATTSTRRSSATSTAATRAAP